MKRVMRLLGTMMALLCSWVAFSADNNVRLVVDEKATQFTVSLPANPTTGYRWRIDFYDHHYFKLLKSKYIGSNPKRMGSGGEMLFVFERIITKNNPADAHMDFCYARPWEPNDGNITHVQVKFKPLLQENH
jgi:inhibitor of cysteine peptidase